MKKIIIALFLILSMVICLPACDPNTNIEIIENPEFEKFNQMFANGFENYTITVTTTSLNGSSVNNEYIVTTENGARKVAYKTEELNKFVIENGVITSNGYKTVSEGIYDADISASESFDVPTFKFSYKYIANDIISPISFEAQISSIKDFMNLDVGATNAKFTLKYSGDVVKSMEISYVTEHLNTVVITYTFK